MDLYLYGSSLSELKGKYPWVFLQPDWNRDARLPQSWSSSSPSLLAGTFPLSLLSDRHSLTHSFPSVPHSTHTHTHMLHLHPQPDKLMHISLKNQSPPISLSAALLLSRCSHPVIFLLQSVPSLTFSTLPHVASITDANAAQIQRLEGGQCVGTRLK